MAKRLPVLIILILALLLIVFHEDVIERLDTAFGPTDKREIIATLEDYNGTVNYKLPKTLVYKKPRKELGLRDQDTLVTGEDGTAIITFASGYKLEVTPNSIIVIEKPQVGEDGAIRITFLRGDFRVLNQGSAGSLVLSKENIAQDPAGRPPPSKPIRISVRPSPSPVPSPILKTEVIDEIVTVAKPSPRPSPKKRETLPDDYIAQIIKKQTPFFNRCYAEHLRLNPNARGRINLSFTIAATGNVSNVRLLGSTLKDPRLEQCTMSVIERARFRKFDGDPIIVNYPINFE